mmetsp:Transcript_9409/g.23168  ORF Transcript_9409/g.23168 Transcript_9409/m.23168 type:complete len:285 (-) Transcript_9409:524-1378(-)
MTGADPREITTYALPSAVFRVVGAVEDVSVDASGSLGIRGPFLISVGTDLNEDHTCVWRSIKCTEPISLRDRKQFIPHLLSDTCRERFQPPPEPRFPILQGLHEGVHSVGPAVLTFHSHEVVAAERAEAESGCTYKAAEGVTDFALSTLHFAVPNDERLAGLHSVGNLLAVLGLRCIQPLTFVRAGVRKLGLERTEKRVVFDFLKSLGGHQSGRAPVFGHERVENTVVGVPCVIGEDRVACEAIFVRILPGDPRDPMRLSRGDGLPRHGAADAVEGNLVVQLPP